MARMNSVNASSGSGAYPRPLLVRDNWTCLNGEWEFGLGADARCIDRSIQVPFAPETPASGLELGGYLAECWYRRRFALPNRSEGHAVWLHFEAADYETRVWVNGHFVGSHEGGYTRFSFDITPFLSDADDQMIVVACADDPHDLAKPRGKQDWLPNAHSIWYPRTSGIWQTVWLETVPAVSIEKLGWTPSVDHWSISLAAKLHSSHGEQQLQGCRLRLELSIKGRVLVDDTFSINGRELQRTISLPDGGIDSVRDELLWSPNRPTLIDATLTLLDREGNVVDKVQSYTAMRSVSSVGDRVMLNGRPIELRMLLDQGYWPETGLTPPDDQAILRDIELVKSMGFNGVRKHQKIESERFLYFADSMGLFVWEEMPSPYRFGADTIRRVTRQWLDAIERDLSHPCIIAWVPINESWSVPDLQTRADQRAFVDSLYTLTKALDPTRLVISNDGWEISRTDLVNIHDYDHDPVRLATRYDMGRRSPAEILKQERPGNRVLLLDDSVYTQQPILLTEFGGIALADDPAATWGYSRALNSGDLARRYCKLLEAVRSLKIFGGFCYTQFTDTYQEANGLVTMDREPKFDPSLIAIATHGPLSPADAQRFRAVLDGVEDGSVQPGDLLRVAPKRATAPRSQIVSSA